MPRFPTRAELPFPALHPPPNASLFFPSLFLYPSRSLLFIIRAFASVKSEITLLRLDTVIKTSEKLPRKSETLMGEVGARDRLIEISRRVESQSAPKILETIIPESSLMILLSASSPLARTNYARKYRAFFEAITLVIPIIKHVYKEKRRKSKRYLSFLLKLSKFLLMKFA